MQKFMKFHKNYEKIIRTSDPVQPGQVEPKNRRQLSEAGQKATASRLRAFR